VTRRNLPDGAQASQLSHAFIEFIVKYPADALMWHKHSNYVALLAAKDEEELKALMAKADKKGIKYVAFYEPALDNHLTSVCFEPTDASRRLTSSIPLALKPKAQELQAA